MTGKSTKLSAESSKEHQWLQGDLYENLGNPLDEGQGLTVWLAWLPKEVKKGSACISFVPEVLPITS